MLSATFSNSSLLLKSSACSSTASSFLHCEENNLNVSELNVFAGNYDTENVIWSSSSSGQFIENTLFPLQPVYQINESDKAAGEVTLFVRVYGDGKCSEDYDEDSDEYDDW